MPDNNSNSLKLIQRAAKRLSPLGKDEAPLLARPDISDTFQPPQGEAPPLVNPDSGIALSREANPKLPHGLDPHVAAEAGSSDRRVQLKLGEMRLNGMITPDNLTSPIAQEYRSIKRKLLSIARNQKTRVIDNNLVMITSALPREGKTFTALNLAISLAAERDLHVMLIDGDVVHPTLSSMFEPRRKHGLVELLNGQCRDMSEIIYRCSDVPNLSVVFSGQPDVKTPELVASRRMADICKDVSSRYPDRIVIIDTPPILASAEPAAMAAHVHQILMVVASGQANRVQLQHALENISACRSISLLFNKAPIWSQSETDSYYDYHRGRAAGQS